jgi:putative ABC transport system permease protein
MKNYLKIIKVDDYSIVPKYLQIYNGIIAYRISPGVWVFVGAIGISLLIGWLTVGYKALKAALANPVNSLRSE